MKIQDGRHLSIEQMAEQYRSQAAAVQPGAQSGSISFRDILQQRSREAQKPESLKFSKHALNRLSDRNIELDNAQMERLRAGAEKAGEKGIRDSLVIIDQLAFIVNVPNRTVVTAMDATATDENIFTNINGAVIA